MMKYFNNSIELPSRYVNEKTIDLLLPGYEDKVIQSINYIQTKISFCFDTWSYKTKQKFIGVTMSYIANSQIVSIVLVFIPYQFDYGSAFISVLIKNKCEEKLFIITSDNGKFNSIV